MGGINDAWMAVNRLWVASNPIPVNPICFPYLRVRCTLESVCVGKANGVGNVLPPHTCCVTVCYHLPRARLTSMSSTPT